MLITIDGSHIIGQCHNRLIGGIGVSYESGIGPVAGSFGRSTDNNLTVSFLLALAAGYHGKNHDYSEQQSQKLFHVAISSLKYFRFVILNRAFTANSQIKWFQSIYT